MTLRSMLAFSILLLALPGPLSGQVMPHPTSGDPRLQAIDYQADQVVQLRSAPGYELMVELAPDEQVQNVAIGDGSAWQASVAKEGNRLFLKPLRGGAGTNMTVVTSVRSYAFDLVAMEMPAGDMPYTVEFRYPAPPEVKADGQYVDVSAISRRLSRYKAGGDRNLIPSQISDDGHRTYIAWPKAAELPAVYAIDRTGKEYLVNGMMDMDDLYIIDGAPLSFVFRIDGKSAWARRINPRKTR